MDWTLKELFQMKHWVVLPGAIQEALEDVPFARFVLNVKLILKSSRWGATWSCTLDLVKKKPLRSLHLSSRVKKGRTPWEQQLGPPDAIGNLPTGSVLSGKSRTRPIHWPVPTASRCVLLVRWSPVAKDSGSKRKPQLASIWKQKTRHTQHLELKVVPDREDQEKWGLHC